jgi:hypothetical protein
MVAETTLFADESSGSAASTNESSDGHSKRSKRSGTREPRSPNRRKLKGLAPLLNSPSLRRKDTPEYLARASTIQSLLQQDAEICIDDLRVIKRLGEGNFATVDLCVYSPSADADGAAARPSQITTGAFVALKRMKSTVGGAEQQPVAVPDSWRRMFEAETLVLRSLQHPNIVACFGGLRPGAEALSEHEPTLLQEYCDGGTLLHALRSSSYGAHEALRWVTEVARGMSYLHGAAVTGLS